MSLNRHMHPRNIYKDRKPDFKALAVKYEEFRKHATHDLKGRVHLDFKKPENLRALSWALLKEDFNLDVDIPLDRLIPTIPLRLNYILWLEDILGETSENQGNVRGIDIGTGASCIYPLLGARKNKWNFLATELDSFNAGYAKKNVEANNLQDTINVVKVAKDSSLLDLLMDDTTTTTTTTYDFCMSNPPFFGSNMEAWGMQTTRSENRPEPSSVSTASPVESICPGGEVQFVKEMIQDSLRLKDRVRVYTTMLGKKSSLPLLKEELRRQGIDNVGTSEFCQGRTMRWGLAWSFDPSLEFPKPPSKLLKSCKAKVPLAYVVPRQRQLNTVTEYSVPGISGLVRGLLEELKMQLEPEANTPEECRWVVTAHENTWSNQRRKRRRQQTSRTEDQGIVEETKRPKTADSNEEVSVSNTMPKMDCATVQVTAPNTENTTVVETRLNSEVVDLTTSVETSHTLQTSDVSPKATESKTGEFTSDSFLLKCSAAVKKDGGAVVIEMEWLEGENKEMMHQVLQYLKNRIK